MKKLLLIAAFFCLAAPALADTGIRIVVPMRDIARGQVIGESDLGYLTIASSNFMSGMATSPKALEGMQARRILHAGESIRSDDVRAPILVTKGQTVTMSFDAPGITLSAMGRAMSEGGMGESITVQNPASYRMVTATITGAGNVRVTGALPTQAGRNVLPRQTARN